MIIELEDGWQDLSTEGPDLVTYLRKGGYEIVLSFGQKVYYLNGQRAKGGYREMATFCELNHAKSFVNALCKAEEPSPVADPMVPPEQYEFRSVVLWPGQRADAYNELNTLGATGFQVIHAYVMGDQCHHFIMQRRKPCTT